VKLDTDSVWLQRTFKLLLDEWGAFLEVSLFYDAIIHFLGGEENVIKEIEATDGARILGKQKIHMLNSNIAFKISSITKDERHYENHFRRFIRYAPLDAIHWINFNHEKVVLERFSKRNAFNGFAPNGFAIKHFAINGFALYELKKIKRKKK